MPAAASSNFSPPTSAISILGALYFRAITEFFDWCDQARLNLLDIEPVHVAAWVESLGREFSPPSVKQWLAAVRMLFDWLVVGQVLAVNPAAAVRGPQICRPGWQDSGAGRDRSAPAAR
jgi:site-specific recombinase XerD